MTRRLPLDLVPDQRDPQRLSAQFDVTQPGRFRIEAAARNSSQLLAEVSTFVEAVPRPGEQDDSPVDMGLLSRLASATGGRIVDPASADGWLPGTAEPPATVVRRQSLDLWHNFTLVLVLCALMAGDWTLRLFRGYV